MDCEWQWPISYNIRRKATFTYWSRKLLLNICLWHVLYRWHLPFLVWTPASLTINTYHQHFPARLNMAQAGRLAKSWGSIHWGSIVLCVHLSPVLAPPGEDVSSQREAMMHYLADPGNHRSHTGVWYLDPSAQQSSTMFCLLPVEWFAWSSNNKYQPCNSPLGAAFQPSS